MDLILTVTMVNVGITVKVLEDAIEDLTGQTVVVDRPDSEAMLCVSWEQLDQWEN